MFTSFMVNAWLIGSIVAVVAGIVGFFVVMRSSAFAAHAIPNGAFAGAAGANLVGINPLVGLGVFSLAAALGIATLSRRGRADAVTALALVMMLALGAAFLSQSTEYEPAIFSLLFGEILGVSTGQLWPVIALGAVCVVAVGVLYRPLLLTSIAPEIAAARGLRPERLEIIFLVVLACATTMTVPVVGALLIFTLMIGPPAAARCFSDRAPVAMGLSVLIGLLTIWGALACAYVTNWPVGFYVGSYSAAWFVIGRLFRAWRRAQGSRRARSGDLARENVLAGA
ncbi:MAG: metal ABC transporter permease [Acidimicrobiales bacterium]|jgi:zinc/manganese transport system permease protein